MNTSVDAVAEKLFNVENEIEAIMLSRSSIDKEVLITLDMLMLDIQRLRNFYEGHQRL